MINSLCSCTRGAVVETADVKFVMDRFSPKKFFFILAPRNIWKLILFFSSKIFSQDESKRYIPTYFTPMFMPNIFNAINI
jgi:hypothetical protein